LSKQGEPHAEQGDDTQGHRTALFRTYERDFARGRRCGWRLAADRIQLVVPDDGGGPLDQRRQQTIHPLSPQRSASHDVSLEGLTENEVWGNERIALRQFDPDIEEMPTFRQVLNFAFTEMVNNAIDHSRGSELRVRWFLKENMLAFEIEDDGIGAFESLRESRG